MWGFHSSGYEKLYSLGYNAVYSVESQRHFGGTCRLHLQGRIISQARSQREASNKQSSCFAYSSTLKMEATRFPETLVDFQRTIWRYIPEDRTLQEQAYFHYYAVSNPILFTFQQRCWKWSGVTLPTINNSTAVSFVGRRSTHNAITMRHHGRL
jgi:hypothetical protein